MVSIQEEKVYFEVFANLFKGIEAVGGKLKITENKLIFQSHAINIQTGTTEVLIKQIAKVKKRNTLGIIPNGMSVITVDGTEYKFVLWNRSKIIYFINKRIDNCESNLNKKSL